MLNDNLKQQHNAKKRKLDTFQPSNYPNKTYKTKDEAENEEFYYIYEAKKKNLSTNYRIDRPISRENTSEANYALKPILAENAHTNIRLFDMCLRFIATNLESVDSLIRFPSQVNQNKKCLSKVHVNFREGYYKTANLRSIFRKSLSL